MSIDNPDPFKIKPLTTPVSIGTDRSGQTQKIAHEWEIRVEGNVTTHYVVVRSKENKGYLLTYKFKGTSEQEQLTQVLALKAMKNTLKSLTNKEAEKFKAKMDRGERPTFYYVKSSNEPNATIEGVILVWPGKKQKPGKPQELPFIWDTKTKCKWYLPESGADFDRALLYRFRYGTDEAFALKKIVQYVFNKILGKSTGIGYVVDPKARFHTEAKGEEKRNIGYHAITQFKEGTLPKKMTRMEEAIGKVKRLRALNEESIEVIEKPGPSSGAVVGRITSSTEGPSTHYHLTTVVDEETLTKEKKTY